MCFFFILVVGLLLATVYKIVNRSIPRRPPEPEMVPVAPYEWVDTLMTCDSVT